MGILDSEYCLCGCHVHTGTLVLAIIDAVFNAIILVASLGSHGYAGEQYSSFSFGSFIKTVISLVVALLLMWALCTLYLTLIILLKIWKRRKTSRPLLAINHIRCKLEIFYHTQYINFGSKNHSPNLQVISIGLGYLTAIILFVFGVVLLITGKGHRQPGHTEETGNTLRDNFDALLREILKETVEIRSPKL